MLAAYEFVLLLSLVGTAPLMAQEEWTDWEIPTTYSSCDAQGAPVQVGIARPPEEYFQATGVQLDARAVVSLVPDPAAWCLRARKGPIGRIEVWEFERKTDSLLAAAWLVLDTGLLVPNLPEFEWVFERLLHEFDAWPSTLSEARERALLFFQLEGVCGDQVLWDLSAFRRNLKHCLGDLPFPTAWFRHATSRLPRSLGVMGSVRWEGLCVSFYVGDDSGQLAHVELVFGDDGSFEVRRILVISPGLELLASPSN